MEGFALDWSDVAPGRLASGDCSGSVRQSWFRGVLLCMFL